MNIPMKGEKVQFEKTNHSQRTECPKSYRKSVLNLLKHMFQVNLSRHAVQICGKFWDTQYDISLLIHNYGRA